MYMINKEKVEKHNENLMNNISSFFSNMGDGMKKGFTSLALVAGLTTTSMATPMVIKTSMDPNNPIIKPSVLHVMADAKSNQKNIIEENIKKIQEFEKKYDISKLSPPYANEVLEQGEQILNSNLKELLQKDQIKDLEKANGFYQELKRVGPEEFNKKYSSHDDIRYLLQTTVTAGDHIYELIENYNKNVMNKARDVANITYGMDYFQNEEIYNLDGTQVFPESKNISGLDGKEELVKNAIVKENPLQTIENLINLDKTDKLNLFSIQEIKTIQDVLDMKQIYLQAKESDVSQEFIDKIQKELNMVANEVFADLHDTIGYQTGVDLQKEMTNMNIYESYNEIKEINRTIPAEEDEMENQINR